MNERERALNCKAAVTMESARCQCFIQMPGATNEPPKQFTFDGTYYTNQTTEQMYNEIAYLLVEGVTEGYNGTIFAYGQTGSGKSFTMQGITDPPSQRGVIPRAFEHIFESIQCAENTKFLVRASYLEIYNEEIRDLLGNDTKQKLEKPGATNEPPKQFTFDGTYYTNQTTEQMYNEIAYLLVEGVTEGYNGTIFAYGQTGSGKSFTMQGITDPHAQRGVIPRAFEHIFESIQCAENTKFLVRASYLEIYNEEIRDLLGNDTKQKLERKKQLVEALAATSEESDSMLLNVYDSIQEEVHAKSKLLEDMHTKLRAAEIEIADLQSEFEFERIDYLATIRRLEREGQLTQQILERVQPLVRRDCNYSNVDRVRREAVWDEDSATWRLPEAVVLKTSLPAAVPPPAQGSLGKQSGRRNSSAENGEFLLEEDRYKQLLNRRDESIASNYFKSKRASQILNSDPMKSLGENCVRGYSGFLSGCENK
ncbi:UNVERIFIED_CONTAM: hypothetical protein FKN15_048556 [Acipenser sinensis]